jgi:hypothetical protein
VLALEELKEAEQQGYIHHISTICIAFAFLNFAANTLYFYRSLLLRDDSLQGLRFYPNIWA